MRRGPLTREELLAIAKVIETWTILARHLGLSDAAVHTITVDYVQNNEEQKMQMLSKWAMEHPKDCTRENLVQIVEMELPAPSTPRMSASSGTFALVSARYTRAQAGGRRWWSPKAGGAHEPIARRLGPRRRNMHDEPRGVGARTLGFPSTGRA